MPVMNTRAAAVIDPILSTHARGYRNPAFVGRELFPAVTIPNRSMRVIRFGKEAFRMLNTKRAPGSNVKRVQYGYASDPISLAQDALEGVVPMEHQQEAEAVPGIDLGATAVDMVLAQVDLGLEFEIATLARNAASYGANNKLTLTGTARWTNAASTPAQDVDAAKEVIRASTGAYPTVLVLSPKAFNALKRHPAIRDQFKYTGKESITAEMLAAYFDVPKVVVGRAVFLAETDADTAPASDVWGADAVLGYVPQAGQTYQVPAFGWTYELSGFPQVEAPYYSREAKSWIYPTTVERRPYLVGAEGGFLFQGAGLP